MLFIIEYCLSLSNNDSWDKILLKVTSPVSSHIFSEATTTLQITYLAYTVFLLDCAVRENQDKDIVLEFTHSAKEETVCTPTTKLSSTTRHHIFSTSCSES